MQQARAAKAVEDARAERERRMTEGCAHIDAVFAKNGACMASRASALLAKRVQSGYDTITVRIAVPAAARTSGGYDEDKRARRCYFRKQVYTTLRAAVAEQLEGLGYEVCINDSLVYGGSWTDVEFRSDLREGRTDWYWCDAVDDFEVHVRPRRANTCVCL